MRRAALLLLLLVFAGVALVPVPVEGLAGPSELRKRSDAHDKSFAARKPAPETVSAALKRPAAPSLRRALLAADVPPPSLVLQEPERGSAPTTPAYLQGFGPANPNALRAPPV